jgi:hypothetical protein
MCSKAHTALTAPLIIFTSYKDLQMRYEKNHASLIAAVNAARVCKLRNGVKKTPQFLLVSKDKGGPSAQ